MPGPNVGDGCHVCEHPSSALINEEINAGLLSRRKIALKWGLGKDSVSRHVYKRHRGVDPSTPDTQDRVDDANAREPTERDKLLVQARQLEGEMAIRPRSDLSRELRQVNARIAELDGANRPKTLGVEDVAGLPEQVAAWFRALEPYPEAREAMLAATDAKLLGASGVEAKPVAVKEGVEAKA